MRRRTTTLLLLAAMVAACQNEQSNENIVITNEIPANAEIETLPADESVGTPTDQLENGSDDADVSDLNATDNSY